MALPCLTPQQSDFRGYPFMNPDNYWKTTASNPCTINVSTLVYEPLILNDVDGKYYTYPNFQLANGKYFNNDKGNGEFLVIVDGVLDTSFNSINYTCSARTNEIKMSTYSDDITGFDTSGNYLFVCYGQRNIVVRYPLNAGDDPTGTIVAGSLGQMDLGRKTLLEQNLLNVPMRIKCLHSNSTFAVYSGGMSKSVKIFTFNGDFVIDLFTTSGSWSYNIPAEGIAVVPNQSNGVLQKLTIKYYGNSDANVNTSVSELHHVTHMDYVLGNPSIPTSYVVVLGMWNKAPDVNSNNYYSLTALCANGTPTSTETATVINLLGDTPLSPAPLFPAQPLRNIGRELISSFCFTKANAGPAHTILITCPVKHLDVDWEYQQYHLTFNYARSGNIPTITGAAYTYLGNYRYPFKKSDGNRFPGNVMSDMARTSDGIVYGVMTYNYSNLDYIIKVIQGYIATAATGATLIGLGLALTDTAVAAWIPILEKWFGEGNVTGTGIIYYVAVYFVVRWVYNKTKPDRNILNTKMKFIHNSGTDYTRLKGDVDYTFNDTRIWLNSIGGYATRQLLAGSNVSGDSNRIFYMTSNTSSGTVRARLNKGLYTGQDTDVVTVLNSERPQFIPWF